MDEVARVVSTAFLVSNDLRRDTEVVLLLGAAPPPAARRIRLQGDRIRFLHPDERSTAALLKNALVRSIPLEHDVEASPGLVVGPADPLAELRRAATEPGAVWLTESGAPTAAMGASFGATAILSDADDPRPEEVEVLEAAAVPKVGLGPRSLRASQCVDLWHNWLDRREAAAAGRLPVPADPPG